MSEMNGTRTAEPLTLRIKGEFLEMPGLSLTPGQAQRLWNMDSQSCQAILDMLVDLRFLHRTSQGRYSRPGAPA